MRRCGFELEPPGCEADYEAHTMMAPLMVVRGHLTIPADNQCFYPKTTLAVGAANGYIH